MRNSSGTILGNQVWAPVKIGQLGFCTGLTVPDDGTNMGARTDVGGAYRREGTSGTWTQIISSDFMTVPVPASPLSIGNDFGCFGLAIAPSDAAVWYMAFRGRMMRSTNRGVNWTDDSLNGSTGLDMDANGGNQRQIQHKLEVDPSNSAVAYFGSHKNGLWQRLSGVWSQIASVPAASLASASDKAIIIAIDRTSALVGSGATSRRSIVYVSSSGNGIYKSTDGGTTFALLSGHPGAGASYIARHMICDRAGNVHLILYGGTQNLWKTSNGGTSWVNNTVVGAASTLFAIEQDPKNTSRFVGLTDNNDPWISLDSLATWGRWNAPNQNASATSLPIIATVMNAAFGSAQSAAAANVLPHPTASKDFIAGGWGTLYFNDPWPTAPATITWKEDAAGCEELVAHSILITPNGNNVLGAHDRGFIRQAAQGYATSSFPPSALAEGYCADYAIDNSDYVACLGNRGGNEPSGISTDGGRNFTQFASFPWGSDGGSLAVGNAGTIVVFPGQNCWPYYTSNGGTSWSRCVFTGINQILDGSENGWGFGSSSTRRFIVCADKLNAGTFYAYNYGPGIVNRNVTSMTNGSATVTVDSTTNLSPGMPVSGTGIQAGSTIQSITSGTVMVLTLPVTATGTPTLTITLATVLQGLWKSTNGGATWSRVNSTSIINASFGGFHCQLRMDRGILYLVPGPSGSDFTGDNTNLSYRSEDGGVNWTVLGQLFEINLLAIGAPVPGSAFHTLYAIGWKTGDAVQKFYRSLDKGATWTLLSNNPTFDFAYAIGGDPSAFGRVLAGYTGTGFAESNYSYKLRLKAS